MAFLLEHFDFVKTSMLFCLVISLCNANTQSVTTKFTEKKCVATSHTTLQKISKIKCVEKCNQERQYGRCTLAGYNKATKTCYLSVDDPQSVLDTTDEMTGVFFLEPETTSLTCAADGPLLNGANPVPDSHFTASSEYSANYLAPMARLDGQSNAWGPVSTDKNTCFLQVRFNTLSTVVRVATKGTICGASRCWVTQYRLVYSEDCVTFVNLLDGAGNSATFPGNVDTDTVVENPLPTPIRAMCLRIYPLGFNTWPDLKIEVYGCPSV